MNDTVLVALITSITSLCISLLTALLFWRRDKIKLRQEDELKKFELLLPLQIEEFKKAHEGLHQGCTGIQKCRELLLKITNAMEGSHLSDPLKKELTESSEELKCHYDVCHADLPEPQRIILHRSKKKMLECADYFEKQNVWKNKYIHVDDTIRQYAAEVREELWNCQKELLLAITTLFQNQLSSYIKC